MPSFSTSLLGQAEPEIFLEELPVRLDVGREAFSLLESPHADPAGWESLRLVLQARMQLRRSHIPLGFVVQFQLVAVRILAEISRTMSQVAFSPADFVAGPFQRRNPPLQSLLTLRSESHMAHAGSL